MGRTAKKRDVPHLPPVEKIQLSEGHPHLRLVAAALLLLLGAGALAYAFTNLLTPQSGWQKISVSSSAPLNCGDEFVLLYNLGAGGTSPLAEHRELVSLYSHACVHAYKLFNTRQSFDGVNNLYDLNQHPNEVLEVEDTLYHAFTLLEDCENRSLYLGPIYEVYDSLFYAADDLEAASFDPFVNQEMHDYIAQLIPFVNDPEAIKLELLGSNRVRLKVSDSYLSYAQTNGVTNFVDFFWLKNAFIIDYLAESLIQGGYTLGSLSSFDGFSRTLDDSGTPHSFNIYDRVGQSIQLAAVMEFSCPMSIVYLRDHLMGILDERRYYQWENGQIRTPYVDAQDGLSRTSTDSLVGYSQAMGCAQILLHMIPSYVGREFSLKHMKDLAVQGVWSVHCDDDIIYHTDPSLSLSGPSQAEEAVYIPTLVS